jgi:hypothetical protein
MAGENLGGQPIPVKRILKFNPELWYYTEWIFTLLEGSVL